MSFRSDFQSQVSEAVKAVYDALGDTVVYKNRAGTSYTLTANVGPEEIELDEYAGAGAERTSRLFSIPKQTSFPESTGVNVGDLITFQSIDYRVDTIKDSSGGYRAVWELQCIRTQPTKLGVKVMT